MINRAVLAAVIVAIAVATLVAGLIFIPRPSGREAAYIACVGVGDPADLGVCVPSPYPDRLPLPDPV